MKFQYVGGWQDLLMAHGHLVGVLATTKFLKLLRFNKKKGMMAATLQYDVWNHVLFLCPIFLHDLQHQLLSSPQLSILQNAYTSKTGRSKIMSSTICSWILNM